MEWAHKTSLIIFDAIKGYINGGGSCGRRPEHDTDTTFRFRIEHNYYDESFVVDIDIPDVSPSRLMMFDDLSLNTLERRELLLTVNGASMPLRTALVHIAVKLGATEWWLKERRPISARSHSATPRQG